MKSLSTECFLRARLISRPCGVNFIESGKHRTGELPDYNIFCLPDSTPSNSRLPNYIKCLWNCEGYVHCCASSSFWAYGL